MWFKLFLVAFFLFSCQKVEDIDPEIELSFELKTPEIKEPFAYIKNELIFLFQTPNPKNKCNLALSIAKETLQSGISSTAFSANQTFVLKVNYTLTCQNGLQTQGFTTADAEITIVPEKTVSQYTGFQHIERQASLRIAREIYSDIKIFFILQKKLDISKT